MKYFLITLLALSFAFPAYAEEKPAEDEEKAIEEVLEEFKEAEAEDTSSLFAPDHCDFEMTFPEEPFSRKRCPQTSDKCYNMTSYTMVYDMATTVDINVTCIPSNESNYDRYNERVIRSALNGMVERAEIEEFEINTEEENGVRKGSLLGTGIYGRQNKIYNAQLWVGPHSILTVEGKLIGNAHNEADDVFGNILASISKKQKRKEKPAEDSDEEEVKVKPTYKKN